MKAKATCTEMLLSNTTIVTWMPTKEWLSSHPASHSPTASQFSLKKKCCCKPCRMSCRFTPLSIWVHDLAYRQPRPLLRILMGTARILVPVSWWPKRNGCCGAKVLSLISHFLTNERNLTETRSLQGGGRT